MRLRPIGEQTIVVYGASMGLGREAALHLARRGARLVVAAAEQEGLDALVQEIRAAGGRAVAIAAEATDAAGMEAVAEGAIGAYGRLDAWVHAGAVALHAPFADTTPDEFRRIVDLNLLGVVHGLMAALPRLRAGGGGALIVVSAVEGAQAMPLSAAYSAAMHGVSGLLDALRMELQHDRAPISVTNIIPAALDAAPGVQAGPVVEHAQWVAEAIAEAAERPRREIVVGGPAKAILKAKRLAPAVAEGIASRTGYASRLGRGEAGSAGAAEGPTPAPSKAQDEGFSCPVCRRLGASVLGRALTALALMAAGAYLVGALLRAREERLEAERRAASPLGRARRLIAQAPRVAQEVRARAANVHAPWRRATRPQTMVERLAGALPVGLHLARRNGRSPIKSAWNIPLHAAPEIGAAVGDIAERFADLAGSLAGLADDLLARGQEAMRRRSATEAPEEQEESVLVEDERVDCV